MSAYIGIRLRRQIYLREQGLCAYCRSAEHLMGITYEIDHVVPLSEGGATVIENLCLTCPTCNRHKANRVSVIDPDTGGEVRLFQPTADHWLEHFEWHDNGALLVGKSAIGRATIDMLRMNRPVLVQLRRYWTALHLHPPRL